jgi:hypothetical protein
MLTTVDASRSAVPTGPAHSKAPEPAPGRVPNPRRRGQPCGLRFSPSSCSARRVHTLAFGGLLLLGGRAADLLGRRRVFLTGLAVFTAASLAAGLASSHQASLSARALQGVGAALLSPAALCLITTIFPEGQERRRSVAMGGLRVSPAARLEAARRINATGALTVTASLVALIYALVGPTEPAGPPPRR